MTPRQWLPFVVAAGTLAGDPLDAGAPGRRPVTRYQPPPGSRQPAVARYPPRVTSHQLPVARYQSAGTSITGDWKLETGNRTRSPGSANSVIRGRVELRAPPSDAEPRPNVSDIGMAAVHGPTDRRRAVVYLDPAPRGAFDARDEPRARLDQRGEAFVPHVLAIVAGTTVDFPNNDLTYHNVFSLSKTRTFDLGRYATGRSKSLRFDRPGIVRVFCDIHSHMSAFILVFAHRYFAVTDDEGRYRLENVPPGAHTVFVWNESAPLESRRALVGEQGAEIEINVTLGRR